jgi:DNA-binding HxlR family transcriptional regulator
MRKNRTSAPPPECPLAECMAILRGAWTPNVIWYLSGGPRRFTELRADIPAVSAKVLTARLRALEAKAVLTRRVMPTSPPSVEYELTGLGRELVPAIAAIVAVGHKLKAAAARGTARARTAA